MKSNAIKLLTMFVRSFSKDGQYNSRTADTSLCELLQNAKKEVAHAKRARCYVITTEEAVLIRTALKRQARTLDNWIALGKQPKQQSPASQSSITHWKEAAIRSESLAWEFGA